MLALLSLEKAQQDPIPICSYLMGGVQGLGDPALAGGLESVL